MPRHLRLRAFPHAAEREERLLEGASLHLLFFAGMPRPPWWRRGSSLMGLLAMLQAYVVPWMVPGN